MEYWVQCIAMALLYSHNFTQLSILLSLIRIIMVHFQISCQSWSSKKFNFFSFVLSSQLNDKMIILTNTNLQHILINQNNKTKFAKSDPGGIRDYQNSLSNLLPHLILILISRKCSDNTLKFMIRTHFPISCPTQ